MARCLNQNLSKVKITPLDPAFTVNLTAVASDDGGAIFPKLKRFVVKLKNHTVVLLILSGLLLSAGSRAAAKGQSKHLTNHRGGKAADQMSNKADTNNNAQWSADPSRGWVRAKARQELRKPSGAAKNNPDIGKTKTKSKRN